MFDQVGFILFDRKLQRLLDNNVVENLTPSNNLKENVILISWYSYDNYNSVWFLFRILIIMQFFTSVFRRKYESRMDRRHLFPLCEWVVHSLPSRAIALTLSMNVDFLHSWMNIYIYILR